MPLHEWNNRPGWEGVHPLWITDLLRWIKPRLPPGYRAYIGSAPVLAIGAPAEKPDVGVRQWQPEPVTPCNPTTSEPVPNAGSLQPDEEIAVATLDPGTSLYVERQNRLIAAVELISPRNKDRPVARTTYLARYLGYLMEGVHLLLVDVHPRPVGFSFADQIAAELQMTQHPCPVPHAISYRVGEPAATGGRLVGVWRRPLTIGKPLPLQPLPLTTTQEILVDLERTYAQAAEDAYLPPPSPQDSPTPQPPANE